MKLFRKTPIFVCFALSFVLTAGTQLAGANAKAEASAKAPAKATAKATAKAPPNPPPTPPAKANTPAAPTPPTAGSAEAIALRVQGFYDNTRTFQARFEQVYHIEAYNRKKRSTGHVTFQRPGRMSWKYDEPNGNRVVSDGKLLKVYEKDKGQLVEQPLGASQYPAVLSFLVGKGNLREMFNLRKLDEKRMNFEGGYVLEGVPKKETSAYTKVIMYIDAETAQVRRMLVIDAQRNRNLFTFSNPTVNAAVPANTFVFTPPTGTQIVRP